MVLQKPQKQSENEKFPSVKGECESRFPLFDLRFEKNTTRRKTKDEESTRLAYTGLLVNDEFIMNQQSEI